MQISFQNQQPLTACTNKCWCKACVYHCQLCFLSKGLGICYKKNKKSPQSNRSLPRHSGNSQTTQKS
ncbi:tat protein [Simian immunodeficiency virus]|uniref:Protein Tat n=1 Tax=Simian immunodeficiency virus TaxID=11723 RepID=V5TB21_SIV|nr:tat protein [Simian immunodeficiency virus]